MLRRQKHLLSQSTTPFACTLGTFSSCHAGCLYTIRVVKTVLLANGHFAGVTPAIFVIFVDFRGPRSTTPCFGGQNAISEFSPIFVKTTCFRQGTKRPFSKTTVSKTLTKQQKIPRVTTQLLPLASQDGHCHRRDAVQ